jgi:hypothetical protein
MVLERVVPKFGALPELRSYKCLECAAKVTVDDGASLRGRAAARCRGVNTDRSIPSAVGESTAPKDRRVIPRQFKEPRISWQTAPIRLLVEISPALAKEMENAGFIPVGECDDKEALSRGPWADNEDGPDPGLIK